eukprot:2900295-Ditylum_brightwellii.AAC.1
MDFEASGAECDSPSYLNFPDCLGSACDQVDIDAYTAWMSDLLFSNFTESCDVETTVVSDGEGDTSNLPDIPTDCLDGM